MKYRLSRYVKLISTVSNELYIFPLLAGKIYKISKEDIGLITLSLVEPIKVPEEYLKNLVELKVILPSGQDELQDLREKFCKAVKSKRTLILYHLTYRCNFNCSYCYQEPYREQRVRLELSRTGIRETKLMQVIGSELDRGSNVITVSWFGGEPLLELTRMKELTYKITSLIGSRARYGAQVITNGYLLTPKVAEELVSIGVKTVQVTLDGPKTHDKYRVLRNSREGTYKRVLDNLRATYKLFDRVIVRVNFLEQDLEEMEMLSLDLKFLERHPRAEIRVVPVSRCQNGKLNFIAEEGYASMLSKLPENLRPSLLHCYIPYCGAYTEGFYVVTIGGEVHKCYISENNISEPALSPFEMERCKNCDVLPLCLGGCPAMQFGESRCYIRYHLKEFLENTLGEPIHEIIDLKEVITHSLSL